MTRETKIQILMEDRCTKQEAEKHIDNGAIIYELDDFIQNHDEYLYSYTDEEKEEFMNQLNSGIAPTDYGLVKYNGKSYLIEYCL